MAIKKRKHKIERVWKTDKTLGIKASDRSLIKKQWAQDGERALHKCTKIDWEKADKAKLKCKQLIAPQKIGGREIEWDKIANWWELAIKKRAEIFRVEDKQTEQ